MYSRKIAMAAAALAVLVSGGMAGAAPWDQGHDSHAQHHNTQLDHRHTVAHARVFETLRSHHYRHVGDPYFVRGHYVVRSQDRFGHVTFVEVDPWSGAFIGIFRP